MYVAKVDTRQKPFIYQLRDVMDRQSSAYFYGAELMRVPPMQIERILKKKKNLKGKPLGLAKFKNYDK